MGWRKVPRFRPYITGQAVRRILPLLMQGKIRDGEWVERFEREFAAYIGRQFAVAVPSGRMALLLCLRMLELREGDGIIVPAFTVPEVVTMIRVLGLTPQFADVDPETCNLTAEAVEARITTATRAVLLTHLFGKPTQVAEILAVAAANGLTVIEDAAQACGASYRGVRTGNFGRLATFSFGLVKNLNTLGGGMIVTDDPALAQGLRRELAEFPPAPRRTVLKNLLFCVLLRLATQPVVYSLAVHPLLRLLDRAGAMDRVDRAFDEKEIGMTEIPPAYRRKFTNLQAALGCAMLADLDRLNDRRRRFAESVLAGLSDLPGLRLPARAGDAREIHLNLLVRTGQRGEILRRLRRAGVDTTRGYLRDCAALPVFAEYARQTCPGAAQLAADGFYLPVNPFFSEKEIGRVIRATRKVLREVGGS
ncbi:MAG: aminotransferase class I/II-fold pyridoxal phosphate-dependent enzyme [Acidobacteria bacterium]|nr:aminotransferase class I/II-fold pyridoxal phosphate-dependent enzyme [Acidobacteriota bacterium]